ncbi:putative ribonuclease h protein [Fagus crenata]
MLDSNGQWCEDEQGMGAIAVQYFNDIFSSSAGLEVEDTVRVLDRVITSDMKCQLLAPFTAVEIQQAAFQMHPSKSPGPDVQIQQVPLANPTGNDSISWKATSTGVFTVKSAYQLAILTKNVSVSGSSSTMKQYHKFWKVLWKIKVPNKIKIHLWRACMNALPTGLALHRRRVINDPLCPVCGVEVETPTHALWTCSYAGSVWALAPGRLSKMPAMHVDFFLLSSQILHSMSHEVVELWAVTAWAIWYARDKFVHEKCLPMPQATIDMAMRLLNDFKRVTVA